MSANVIENPKFSNDGAPHKIYITAPFTLCFEINPRPHLKTGAIINYEFAGFRLVYCLERRTRQTHSVLFLPLRDYYS
ncbi:MAG: hypothetical protein CRN43_07520 [Candidatus Nephrothrix sp. EaCA]|nr:MAG: hypothetical protein CRN43_07520 [Candidatus Nephrothrix sp. EaCA]